MPPRGGRSNRVLDLTGGGPPDRGNASGRATRERLMILGERLFAERGIDVVSLREIGLEAGQRNNNVIQYHFGDRAGLVGAIYAFRSEALNRRRLELVDEFEATGAREEPAALLRILLRPHVESIRDPENHFLGFLARLILDLGSMRNEGSVAALPYMEAHHHLRERVRLSIPRIPRAVFDRRFDLLFNFAVTALAAQSRLNARHESAPLEDLLEEVVAIMVAGLTAPPPGGAPTADDD